MATYFFDTSGLAKRYITETGTAWVQALTDPVAGHHVYVARITLVELVSAITRRERNGDLTPAAAQAALADVRDDFTGQYAVIDITAKLIGAAAGLARIHALRGYDAVQLAAAQAVHAAYGAVVAAPVTLISSDSDLNDAGRVEGLIVDDPNTH